ncbi:spore germination protein GerPB [Siminovitchia sediminis]|uniref:Spore germination protein GerPB n=1 Tax=Siminovitchia sediminis TaxID=1274353 RepID=A0ABW4KP58_9BACI
MIINVNQTIQIQMIKIGGITNSSVLQIGTSGVITPSSHLYNTGGYSEPAPPATAGVGEGTVSLVPFH